MQNPRAMSLSAAALFELSRQALGATQAELGAMLGASRRAAQRWSDRGVPSYHLLDLARLVHPRNPSLAEQLAAAAGTTLEAAGIVLPAPPVVAVPPAATPADGVVDAVVCAAAEAMDMKPPDVRAGLHAAFARAREIGLTVDFVERVLGAKSRAAVARGATTTVPDRRK